MVSSLLIVIFIAVLIAMVMWMDPEDPPTTALSLPSRTLSPPILEEDRPFRAYKEALAEARALRRRGCTDRAEFSYQRAIEALQQSQRSRVGGIAGPPYRELAELLVERHRPDQALAVCEQYIFWQRKLGHRPDPRMLEVRQRIRKQIH